jgi:hypothetical protein
MRRFATLLILSAALGWTGYAQAGCPGSAQGCGPYWCDPYANLRPWPNDNDLYDGPRNWAWWYPHGGFTAYPGQAGSGIKTGSDYSHVNWVTAPASNAQLVTEKLQSLGIPLVPQETTYLGKNPAAVNKAKLPQPKSWIKDVEPVEPEKEKGKEIEKDKAKDNDKDKDN